MPPKPDTRKRSCEAESPLTGFGSKFDPLGGPVKPEKRTKLIQTIRSKEAGTSKGREDERVGEESSSSIRRSASKVTATIIPAKRSKEEDPVSSRPDHGFETIQADEEGGSTSSQFLRNHRYKSTNEVEFQHPRAQSTHDMIKEGKSEGDKERKRERKMGG